MRCAVVQAGGDNRLPDRTVNGFTLGERKRRGNDMAGFHVKALPLPARSLLGDGNNVDHGMLYQDLDAEFGTRDELFDNHVCVAAVGTMQTRRHRAARFDRLTRLTPRLAEVSTGLTITGKASLSGSGQPVPETRSASKQGQMSPQERSSFLWRNLLVQIAAEASDNPCRRNSWHTLATVLTG